MTTYSYSQLEALWKKAGGNPVMAPLMAAIAEAESSGNPNATNPTDNNGTQTSWGLWQISNGTHAQPVPNILSPLVNAEQAVAKYKSQGLGAWGTYTSGAYKRYLGGAGTAPSSGTSSTGTSGISTTGAFGIPGLPSQLSPSYDFAALGKDLASIAEKFALVLLGGALILFGLYTMLKDNDSSPNAPGGSAKSSGGTPGVEGQEAEGEAVAEDAAVAA